MKLSSIGDIVHTLPAVAAIHQQFPAAEISWVAERGCAEVLRKNPILTRLIEVDTRSLRRKRDVPGKAFETAMTQLRELRVSEFDLSIDFQGLLKSASIAKISKAKRRYGFDKASLREPASRLLLSDRISVEPKQNVIFKNLDLAEGSMRDFLSDPSLALERDALEFPIRIDREHILEAGEIIDRTGNDFALLNPAGGWVTKLWPAENYGRLADLINERLGISSLITTARSEKHLAETALSASSSGSLTAETPSIKAFFQIARKARFYVGGDTGPTHLAVAAGCPVIGIFGPTEWWRNGSPRKADMDAGRSDIDCRTDCHRRECGKWICMDIPVEAVFDAVQRRLG